MNPKNCKHNQIKRVYTHGSKGKPYYYCKLCNKVLGKGNIIKSKKGGPRYVKTRIKG